jgi:hypothetical protein
MKIIISENQVDKIKSKIHEYVKKYGVEKCKEIFGNKVLFTIGFNNDPMEYLNLFNDLKQVQSIENKGLTLFRYEKGKNLMVYDNDFKYIYINQEQFWLVLRKDFGLEYYNVIELIMRWVGMVYNLMEVTNVFHYSDLSQDVRTIL